MLKLVVRVLGVLVGVFVVGALAGYLAFSDPPAIPATADQDPTVPSVEVGGVMLHAEVFGSEDAPVIVVLHGGPGGDYRSLLPLQALSDDYRIVFYDQRGAGLSQRLPREELTLETHVAELDDIVDLFGLQDRVVLIGHSWGATLAAAYLGAFPDRVSQAILIEPGFLDQAGRLAWENRARGLIADLSWSVGGLGDLAATFFRSLHVSGPDPDARMDYFMGNMVLGFAGHPENPYHCPDEPFDVPVWRFGATTMTAVSEQADGPTVDVIAAQASRFEGPVLFLTGACDDWLGTALQSRHMELFQNARLVEIPDAGHDVIHDQPSLALSAIRSFLN